MRITPSMPSMAAPTRTRRRTRSAAAVTRGCGHRSRKAKPPAGVVGAPAEAGLRHLQVCRDGGGRLALERHPQRVADEGPEQSAARPIPIVAGLAEHPLGTPHKEHRMRRGERARASARACARRSLPGPTASGRSPVTRLSRCPALANAGMTELDRCVVDLDETRELRRRAIRRALRNAWDALGRDRPSATRGPRCQLSPWFKRGSNLSRTVPTRAKLSRSRKRLCVLTDRPLATYGTEGLRFES